MKPGNIYIFSWAGNILHGIYMGELNGLYLFRWEFPVYLSRDYVTPNGIEWIEEVCEWTANLTPYKYQQILQARIQEIDKAKKEREAFTEKIS